MSALREPDFTLREHWDGDTLRYVRVRRSLTILGANELVAQSAPPTDLVAGLFPADNATAVLAGPTKIGKSLLANDLAQVVGSWPDTDDDAGWGEVRRAATFLGRPAEIGPVLYVQAEGSQAAAASRVARRDPGGARSQVDYVFPRGFDLMDDDDLAQLMQTVDTGAYVLVILDSLARLCRGLGRNDVDLDTAAMDRIRDLAEKADTNILAIHHLTKPVPGYRPERALDMVRGTTAITAAADAILVLTRRRDGRLLLQGELRDGPPVELVIEREDETFRHRVVDPASIASSRVEAEQRRVVAAVVESRQASVADLAKLIGRSKPTTQKKLDAAVEAGMLARSIDASGAFVYVPAEGAKNVGLGAK